MTNKTFYITYCASKHKKHITRLGKHDDKSRYGTSKQGVPCLDTKDFPFVPSGLSY